MPTRSKIKTEYTAKLTVSPSKKKKRLATLIFLFAFAVYSVSFTLLFGHACPINLVFGIPCPSCGMTRAVLSLLRGDIVTAFCMHPLVFTLPFIAVFFAVGAVSPTFAKSKAALVLAIITLFLFVATYGLRIAFSFGIEPMAFNRRSLLFLIIDFFRSIS